MSVRFKPWCQRETTLPHTFLINPGTLCHHYHPQQQVSGQRKCPIALTMWSFLSYIYTHITSTCISAYSGTLISHEKLLLQINTEREMGNMDYKLGQVSKMTSIEDFILLAFPKRIVHSNMTKNDHNCVFCRCQFIQCGWETTSPL